MRQQFTISSVHPISLLLLLLLIGIWLLVLPSTAGAQQPPRPGQPASPSLQPVQPHVEYLTVEDGLTPGGVTAIVQDRQGFMWIGTQNGLHRYDGYELVPYSHDPADPSSISGNLVHDIIEDQQGYLWIAAGESGVNRYDPQTDRFTRYQYNPNDPASLSDLVALMLFEDRNGTVWVVTLGGNLNCYNPTTDSFTAYPLPLSNPDGVFPVRPNSITQAQDGSLWIGIPNGLLRFDPQSGEVAPYPVQGKMRALTGVQMLCSALEQRLSLAGKRPGVFSLQSDNGYRHERSAAVFPLISA